MCSNFSGEEIEKKKKNTTERGQYRDETSMKGKEHIFSTIFSRFPTSRKGDGKRIM